MDTTNTHTTARGLEDLARAFDATATAQKQLILQPNELAAKAEELRTAAFRLRRLYNGQIQAASMLDKYTDLLETAGRTQRALCGLILLLLLIICALASTVFLP